MNPEGLIGDLANAKFVGASFSWYMPKMAFPFMRPLATYGKSKVNYYRNFNDLSTYINAKSIGYCGRGLVSVIAKGY